MDESPPSQGPRPRYVRRVTAEDVGERVSVRCLTEDGGSGPSATDIVGRLAVFDDEVLMVVDHHVQLHVIDHGRVLASRVVPPHPRRPPEPTTGTPDAPLRREAGRALVLDDRDRILLVGHSPASDRVVWTAPGGGLRPGEDHRTAAHRELREEIGVSPPLGPWIWRRRVTFSFRGLWLDQNERWFLTRLAAFDPATAPLVDHGADEARWWSAEELARGEHELAPRDLPVHLETLLRTGPPGEPVDVGC